MAELNYSKKQIEPIINKYQIDINSKQFAEIITMFNGQTPYQIWALKCVYGGIAPLNKLAQIKEFADENAAMIAKLEKKTLTAYTSKEDFKMLDNEIVGAVGIMIAKRGIEQFNTRQREMFKTNLFGESYDSLTPLRAGTSKKFAEYVNFFKRFNSMKSDRRQKLIVTASAINDNFDFLVQHIKDSFSATYDWEKEDLLSFIATNPTCKDVKVVFNNGPIVVLEIPCFEASKLICGNGRTSWCITRDKSYFHDYAEKTGNRQFFYFDFSKKETHATAHVGFTVNRERGVVYAHTTQNTNICGSGTTIDGKTVNIDTILNAAKIDKSVFIHLNGIKGFNWDINDVIDYINKNSKELTICANNNGRLVVKIHSTRAFQMLCHNTLVKSDSFNFDIQTVFTVLDLNLPDSADRCMVTMAYAKDTYGTLSLKKIVDAFNTDITKSKYLDSVGITQTSFLGDMKIDPSVLLHKFLDENCETDVLNLLGNDGDKVDVNYVFNNRTPIFTAINNKMYRAFEAIINNPKYVSSNVDQFGEPLLLSLIIDYRETLANGGNAESVKPQTTMIQRVLASSNTDINMTDINLDTAVGLSAERSETNWILDLILQNPNVDINIPNDLNCTPFASAIMNKNWHALTVLGARPDLKIREEDVTLAQQHNIDLSKYVKPTAKISGIENVDANATAKAFANAFAK